MARLKKFKPNKSIIQHKITAKPRLRREANAILYIGVLRNIMNIFYGPFLTMYFFKISMDSLQVVSLYNIFCYALVGILPLMLGFIVKKRFQLATFRLGILINLAYIIFIIVMREAIVDHLFILALLFGTSTSLFFYPHNMLNGAYVKPNLRDHFELKKKLITSIAIILVPFLFGLFITATDFIFTTSIILVLSVAQIALSLFLKPVDVNSEKFTPIRSLKILRKDANVRESLWMSFVRGMTTSDSAMQVMMTLLIFNSFETDLNLGIISSVSNLFLVILSYFYLHSPKLRDNRFVLLSFAIVPLIGLILFLSFTSDLTLVIYYLFYNLSAGIIQMLITIKIYNVSTHSTVRRGNTAEFWSMYEFSQGCGRVLSFGLLLLAGALGQVYLYGLYLLLTLMLFLTTRSIRRIRD